MWQIHFLPIYGCNFELDRTKGLSWRASWIAFRLAGVSSKLSSAEVENHLEQGKKLLATGQLSDALGHYHAAVGKWNLLQWIGVDSLEIIEATIGLGLTCLNDVSFTGHK